MNKFLVMSVLALGVWQTGHAQTKAKSAPTAQAAEDSSEMLFKAWDKNSDGQLSETEFKAGWEHAQQLARTQMALRRQFSILDANHDGGIDATEYGNLVLIKNAGKNAPPFARFDANANAKLEFAEYLKLVEALAPQQANAKGAKK
ncbi:MAG: hypothetical protein KUL77_06105 [Thermomonas sp.]|jgi:Ca2+-binding EF-hand superfamily protein|uniref:EF-hand domain-containing protein n=1 Tax=Thermomonas sp. TaxID=1971895 RepID=UPI001EC689CC|nr:hypothetical protein [Thermomonas sp.]MBV2209118.1 hypothetical protein [Thermomonas sp.]